MKVSLFKNKNKEFTSIVLICVFIFFREIAILIPVIYFILRFKEENVHSIQFKNIIDSLITFLKFVPIIYFVSFLSKYTLPGFLEQDIVLNLKRSAPSEIFKFIVSIVIVAPIIEEITFRGLFYRILKKNYSILISSVIVALIFSIVHLNILAFTVLVTLSLFLNYIYEKYGSIFYPILLHSTFNTIMIILIFTNDHDP